MPSNARKKQTRREPRRSLSLRLRVPLLIVSSVALLGLVNTLYLESHVFSEMEEELEQRWQLMARYLAGESVELILYQDYLRLGELLSNAKTTDADFTYSFVVDPVGRVLAHTFTGDFPETLLRVNTAGARPGGHIRRIAIFDQNYRDFAVPIHGGELGTLRLGVRDQTITERLDDVRNGLLMLMIPIMLLGAAVAYGWAQMLLRDLRPIITALDRFVPGRHREEIPVRRRDELGEIAREVNEITARLHETQTVLLRSEKLASIGTMASGIAHELNNPITGLQNCLTRIQANPDNAKQTEEYVELMLGTVRHMDATVSALLAFARKSAVELRTVDLRAVVHKAAELVAFRFERSRVEVACRMPDDAVNVRGDSATLTQVAVNLLANAVDAMPEGGAVTVALDAAEGRACLRVRDEGTGISAEDLEKIFDPFFTTKEAGQGTGLGLAVAHRVAVDHGGELRVSSRLGEGTEFVLCLPLLDQEQET